ncbi:hypothetical protein, partial [Variovorax boronicumulans]|uniref:hypothetical protein n=1 Tax=Variovorax boronicumulans TaxID=436515 RepID=UPI001C3F3734
GPVGRACGVDGAGLRLSPRALAIFSIATFAGWMALRGLFHAGVVFKTSNCHALQAIMSGSFRYHDEEFRHPRRPICVAI